MTNAAAPFSRRQRSSAGSANRCGELVGIVEAAPLDTVRIAILFAAFADVAGRVVTAAVRGTPPVALWLESSALIVLALATTSATVLPERRRIAVVTGLSATFIVAASSFPATANHTFLTLFVLLILALPNSNSPADAQAALNAVTWLAGAVFFWAGIQKLVHGAWFRGQFVAVELAGSARFHFPLSYLLPSHELERLRELGRPLPGVGPYLLESWSGRACSLLVPMAEILAGLFVAFRPRKTSTVVAASIVLLCIEVVAREISFGAILTLMIWTQQSRVRLASFVTSAVLTVSFVARVFLPTISLF